jgi:hypothetical protein
VAAATAEQNSNAIITSFIAGTSGLSRLHHIRGQVPVRTECWRICNAFAVAYHGDMKNQPPNDPQEIIFILSFALFLILTLPPTLWTIIRRLLLLL